MTVVLVSSPVTMGLRPERNLSLGLVTVATCLGKAGLPARLLDVNGVSDDPLYRSAWQAILEADPSAVGFSTLGSGYPVTLRLARELRARRPALPLVLGGPQASLTARGTLEAFPQIDVVVRGRCEEFVAEVFAALGSERSRARLATLPGVTYRDGGAVVERPDAPDPAPETLPVPDYGLVASFLAGPGCEERVPVEAGIGCPGRCRFCAVEALAHGHRMLPVERVVSVAAKLHERFGTRRVSLVCDCLTHDRRWVLRLCDAWRRAALPVTWAGQTRADLVDEELLDAMRGAGCDSLYFGVETGSTRLQRSVRKGLDVGRVERSLSAAGARGLEVVASFIVGFPEETPADLAETARLALRLAQGTGAPRFTLQVHLLAPLSGSPLEAERRGRLARDGAASDVADGPLTPEDDALVSRHPDLFPSFFHVPTPHLSRERLAGLRFVLLTLFPLRASCRVLLGDPALGFPEALLASPLLASGSRQPADAAAADELEAMRELLDRWLVASGRTDHPLRELLRFEVALRRDGGAARAETFAFDVARWAREIAEGGLSAVPPPPPPRPTTYLLARRDGKVVLRTLAGPGSLAGGLVPAGAPRSFELNARRAGSAA